MNPASARIEIARDPSVFDLIENQYDSLVDRADWINPYFSPEWLRCWWNRQSNNLTPLIILALSGDDKLLGFWPFVQRPGLLGSRGLWPFVYDEANYHFPTCINGVVPLLVDRISQLFGSYLFVWIPQIPQSFWEKFLQVKVEDSPQLTLVRTSRSSTQVVPVDGQEFEEFWEEKKGTKSRKSFGYDERSLARQGKVTWDICTTFSEVRSSMPSTCLVEVESSKSEENAGLYSIRGKRGFFFELLPELAKSSRARLSFLRVNDHPVAWQLELLSPRFSYLHHLAYDKNWKKYSPGKQLLKRGMHRCWEELRTLDFLPAFFTYKQELGNEIFPVFELHWIKRSIRGRIARRLIRWNMEWRRKIRARSPGLAASVAREQVTRINEDSSK